MPVNLENLTYQETNFNPHRGEAISEKMEWNVKNFLSRTVTKAPGKICGYDDIN